MLRWVPRFFGVRAALLSLLAVRLGAAEPKAVEGESIKGDALLDGPGIPIAHLSLRLKTVAGTSDQEFEYAINHTKAQQESEARMAAVRAGELTVFEAEKLHGQERVDRLERGARAGEAAAAEELGDMLDLGNGLNEDPVRAVGYYRAAALGGRMDAAHNLGAALAAGRGVRRDFAEALAWLMVARSRGDRSGGDEQLRQRLEERKDFAAIAVAEKRVRELSPKVPAAEVIAALPPAAALESVGETANAEEVNLSDLKSGKSHGTEGSEPEVVVMTITGVRRSWPSLATLQRAAFRGEPAALGALGRLLAAGKLLPADPLRAVVLLEQSAALGDVDAAHQLGDLYAGGDQILRDDTKAFTYYLKAAQGGCALSMGNVGVYFTNARGTERDYAKGLAWLTVAKHYGVDLGQEKRLRAFLAKASPGDIAKADALSAELIRDLDARPR